MRNMLKFYRTTTKIHVGKFTTRLSQALIISSTLLVSGMLYAAPAPDESNASSLQLTIRYNSDTRSMEVINQRIVNFPAPKNRSGEADGRQLVFQYEDGTGAALGSVPLNDPTVLRSEWVNESSSEAGMLTGNEQTVTESVFQVTVPLNENLNQVKLLKPRPRPTIPTNAKGRFGVLQANGAAGQPEVLGRSSVDNASIRAFINRKKQQ